MAVNLLEVFSQMLGFNILEAPQRGWFSVKATSQMLGFSMLVSFSLFPRSRRRCAQSEALDHPPPP